jgi:hypothetical protein
MMPMTMRGGEPKQEEMQALVATVGVCYAIFWLYFLLFETFGGAARPGSASPNSALMSVHGGPASASAVVLRRRARGGLGADVILPVLGGIVMFTTKRAQHRRPRCRHSGRSRARRGLRLPSRGGRAAPRPRGDRLVPRPAPG